MGLCYNSRAASHASKNPYVAKSWEEQLGQIPGVVGTMGFACDTGGKGVAVVFEKERAYFSPGVPLALWQVQHQSWGFHSWHLDSNRKVPGTPWTPISLYRHIWLHLNRWFFFSFMLILHKTSLVSITIYSTGNLGLFLVPLHLIIFSRAQSFDDMQILTGTWHLLTQTSISNKPTMATYNVEEFYSYHKSHHPLQILQLSSKCHWISFCST